MRMAGRSTGSVEGALGDGVRRDRAGMARNLGDGGEQRAI